MIESISNKPKFSKSYSIYVVCGNSAKAKDYKEAHRIKMRADQLEAWELGSC